MSTLTTPRTPTNRLGTLLSLLFVVGVLLFSGAFIEPCSARTNNASSLTFGQALDPAHSKACVALTVWAKPSAVLHVELVPKVLSHFFDATHPPVPALCPTCSRLRFSEGMYAPERLEASKRHLPAVALAKTSTMQPCRVSHDSPLPQSQKNVRSLEKDNCENEPLALEAFLCAPVLPLLVLAPTKQPQGIPLCSLPAARGLVFFSTPPPSCC